MRISKQCVISSLLILSISYDVLMAVDSPCGDWEPFKEEKCFKIFDKVGLQTYEDALRTCQQQENDSTLISIRYLEEQEFISNFLFKTNKVVDAVWIGAKYSSNKFRWTDDSDLSFTNWAEGSPSNTTDKACVQMIAEGSTKGKWISEPCNKSNKVVCQKMQIWSLSRLHKTVLGIMSNPVPIGFIYVQMPSQPEPKSLWPMVEWKDVTSDYAGLFFRAEGGDSAAFGTLQNGNVPSKIIDSVGSYFTKDSSESKYNGNFPLPSSGWSPYLLSAVCPTTSDGLYSNFRFHVSANGGENRPINKAVRIWKRTN